MKRVAKTGQKLSNLLSRMKVNDLYLLKQNFEKNARQYNQFNLLRGTSFKPRIKHFYVRTAKRNY